MDTLEAIILGAVQGLTEFLPVSSSGHLQLAKELMGVEIAENLTFDITLHAATVLSTIVVLWREIWRLLRGVFSRHFNAEQAFVLKLLLSMIPIGIVGLRVARQHRRHAGLGLHNDRRGRHAASDGCTAGIRLLRTPAGRSRRYRIATPSS